MADNRPRATIHPYDKKTLVMDLEQSKEKVEEAILDWESKLEEWRSTIVGKFSDAVKYYDPTSTDYNRQRFRTQEFEPPTRPEVCRDYRVVNLNKAISRLVAMAPDENGVIRLSSSDPILTEYLAYASCL